MDAEHRTATLPDEQRGAFFDGVDAVTALRVRGLDIEHALLIGKNVFSLGSAPECDVVIDSSYLSSLHCVLERRGSRVRVHDQTSKNGTYFGGRKETTFDIGPGDSFITGTTTLFALNEEMRLARPVMAEIIGNAPCLAVDEALIASVRGTHVILTGEDGNDQDRLARAIHTASLRRKERLVTIRAIPTERSQQEQLVATAHRGTLLLRLGEERNIDPGFLSLVQAPETNIRIISSVASLSQATQALGIELVSRSYQIAITPLRERPGDLLPLLERWFIDRRTPFRVSYLTDANRAALCVYRWPGNLEELRFVADRLVQLAPYDSIRAAAPAIDIPRTSLQRWVDNLGLALPLLAKTG